MPNTRELNYAMAGFDNLQRPTIAQLGNAIPLSVDKINESIKSGAINKENAAKVISGNILSSSLTDKKNYRNLVGVGETTTGVMLDVKYMTTNSLQVLMDNNFEKVINNASVDLQIEKKKLATTYMQLRDSISTFEQERIMDSRIAEATAGLVTARTQKLGKGFDITNTGDISKKEELKKLQMFTNARGKVYIDKKTNELVYKSSDGKLVKRGEKILDIKGHDGSLSPFAAKVDHGVFNFKFYNEEDIKVTDENISKIINKHKDLFFNSNGEFIKDKRQQSSIIEGLLQKQGIKGQYVIEDISALGYAKTMSGSEKGMTDILFATTGKYNKNIKNVFSKLDVFDIAGKTVLTEEGTVALLKHGAQQTKQSLSKVLKEEGFNSINDLKAAMAKERAVNSSLIFDYLFNKKTHAIVNDNVVGHGNVGQMLNSIIAKTSESIGNEKMISYLNKDYKININGKEEIANIFSNLNLNTGEKTKSLFSFDKSTNRIVMGELGSTLDNSAKFDIQAFMSMMKEIDEKELKPKGIELYHEKAYYMDNGKLKAFDTPMIGDFDYKEMLHPETNEKIKVLTNANTKEMFSFVKDPETQTSYDYEFLSLKRKEVELRKEKIAINKQIDDLSKTKDPALKAELSQLKQQRELIKSELDNVSEHVKSYNTVVKAMKMGDQEIAIMERLALTNSHADFIKDLIDKNEDDSLLQADSIRGMFKSKGDLNNSPLFKYNKKTGKYEGIRALDPFVSRLKENQFYNANYETLLTADNINTEEYSKYKDIYEQFNSKNMKISAEKADEVMQARAAVLGTQFNTSLKSELNVKQLTESLHDDYKYEISNINDIAVGVDEIATKNILLDMGEEFGEHRYLAMPGIGSKFGDTEIKKDYQAKLSSLQHRYQDYILKKGTEESLEIKEQITKQLSDMSELVQLSVTGKNNLLHDMSKVTLDMPAIRHKASGSVWADKSEQLKQMIKRYGIEDNYSGLETAMIDGKSISE